MPPWLPDWPSLAQSSRGTRAQSSPAHGGPCIRPWETDWPPWSCLLGDAPSRCSQCPLPAQPSSGTRLPPSRGGGKATQKSVFWGSTELHLSAEWMDAAPTHTQAAKRFPAGFASRGQGSLPAGLGGLQS